MESIPHPDFLINAADPQALTRLLDLPEVAVIAIEQATWLARRYIQCRVVTDGANCSRCAGYSHTLHQYHTRTVRDLPWAGWACYRQITTRRWWCARCRTPFTAPLAAVAPCARTTRRYAAHLVAGCRTGTVQQVARQEAHGYKAVEGIVYRHATAQYLAAPPATPIYRLGLDEIAARKGHGHFKLVLVDLDGGRVIEQLPDRDKATLRRYLLSWSAAARAAVTEVAVDFWAAYHEVAAELLPQARVVGDRFHVQKHLNEAVQITRRRVQQTLGAEDAAFVRRHRQLLVCNEEDLDAPAGVNLTVMKVGIPLLDRVHTRKERFRSLFNAPLERASAAEELQCWVADARQSGAAALREFAGFVVRWEEPILNYFVNRTSSGMVEGLNNKIKLIKRQAFGFRNDEHFRLRVLLACDGAA